MTDLIPFAFDSHAVRVVYAGADPWFVAADIAAALDYAEAKDLTRQLDEDEKGRQIVPTPGGDQEVSIISESGLYTAILRSRKPEAKRFRKWVTAEVLPSLRRTGSYGVAPAAIATVPAAELASTQAELLDVQRKLIDTQERLLRAVGPRRVRGPFKPITSDEIAEMKRLRATGLPVKEVARRLGRNESSVSQLTRDVRPTADLFGGAA